MVSSGLRDAMIVSTELRENPLATARVKAEMRYAFIGLVLISGVTAIFWSVVIATLSHWMALGMHAAAIIAVGAGIFAFIFIAAAGLMLDND